MIFIIRARGVRKRIAEIKQKTRKKAARKDGFYILFIIRKCAF